MKCFMCKGDLENKNTTTEITVINYTEKVA